MLPVGALVVGREARVDPVLRQRRRVARDVRGAHAPREAHRRAERAQPGRGVRADPPGRGTISLRVSVAGVILAQKPLDDRERDTDLSIETRGGGTRAAVRALLRDSLDLDRSRKERVAPFIQAA